VSSLRSLCHNPIAAPRLVQIFHYTRGLTTPIRAKPARLGDPGTPWANFIAAAARLVYSVLLALCSTTNFLFSRDTVSEGRPLREADLIRVSLVVTQILIVRAGTPSSRVGARSAPGRDWDSRRTDTSPSPASPDRARSCRKPLPSAFQ